MAQNLTAVDSLMFGELPSLVEVGSQRYHIETDYRVGIQFELLMQDTEMATPEKLTRALLLYYGGIPSNVHEAIDRMLWFYRCGKDESDSKGKTTSNKKAYDFEQDADMLIAAFWQSYGIDLATVTGLHWWAFRALMRGLPPDSEFRQAMGYRTMSTQGMSKAQKKHYEKMRSLYALKNKRSVSSTMSLEERNNRMKDYVARRFAETERGGLSQDDKPKE